MSLLEKFKKYLQDQTTPASKATIKNYLADVGQFIKWCEDKFGYFSPKDINYVTISTYKKIKNDSGISLSSIDRHISSLRKFHTFLSISSHDIESNPFVDPISNFNNIVPTDKWSIKKFKDYLYACNSSPLTIKNYIADVRQFTNWIESHMAKNGQGIWTENLLEKIDNSLLQKYKDNLINSNISALSINRKLSSNRKYTGWAQDKGLMHFQSEIINIKKPTSQYSIPKNNNDLSSNVNMINTNNSLYSNNDNRLKIKYSILPPIRLLQKIWNGILWILDEIFTGHIIDIIENIDYLLWKSNGKRIFVNTKKISKNIINNISSNKKLTIANISKYNYSHHEISTTSMPLHFKILHHLRNTRPNWYHKYHSYSISHYLHFAILVIVMSALGFGFYQKFIQETGTKSIALAGPISPNRVLSFQGRLTDSNDIPITSQKKLRFSIYSNETSTAAAAIEPFLWQELRIATPDADGIFSVLLGSNPTGGPTGLCGDFPATTPCGIKQSIFGDHDLLWLGVSVENDSELTPRQQIATVAFATNSELLQGLPPTIDTAWISNNTNTNAILALNSSGTLSIGGASGSKTTFQANGKYTLTGRVLSINTTAGTDTNIEITPDGIGKIDVQKPLQNSTSSNNILSSIGSVEIDDTFSVLATSSGIPAATINQNGSGDIFTASSSGNTKFTITNSGNVGIGSVMPGYKLDVTGDINVSGGFKINGVSFTGSSQWTTNLDNSIYFNTGNVGIGTTAPIGLLHVSGSVGGNSIGIINNEGSVGDIFTASSSGNTKFTITNFGNVGIGSITPNAKLQIVGSDTSNSIFAANIGGSTGTGLIVTNSGNVGIGTTAPLATLDVRGNLGTAPAASFSGQTSFATMVVGNDGFGDIFTASKSGLTKFTILNSGNAQFSGDALPDVSSTRNLGSLSKYWNNIYVNNIFQPVGNGTSGFWTLTDSVMYPTQYSLDLAVGSTNGTASAKFQIFGSSVGDIRAGDASTSASLVFNGAASPTIDILNNQRLDFQTSSGGDTGLTARLSILGNGNIGIGTTAPLATLDVRGNLGTAPVASFSGQTSFATMVVGNDGFGDIFTASKSGLTKFTILNSGNVGIGTTVASRTLSINGETEANAFYDISNNSYFLDPAAVGTSLRIAGSASFNGDLTLGGGTGKLDVGTVDPPYTINGEKYATFIPAMTGIKEETTGKARTSEYVSGLGYKYTIDFTKVEKGSDLWLFSKATDMGKNIGKIIPLMSATDNTKIWYNIDESNYSLTLYSAKPTTIAYRLTAPRFDADIIDITKSSSPGFILNDGKELHAMTKSGNFTDEELLNINNLQIIKYESRYDLRTKSGEIIHEVASYSEIVVANLRAGLINAREIIAKSITTGQLTVSKEIISPIAEIDRIHTNLISPLSSDNIVVDGKLVIANKENVSDNEIILEVQGNASISGVLRAGKIIADEIIGLDAKIATLAGKNITNITNIYSNASTSATIDSQNDSSSGDNIAKINTEDLLIDVPIFSGLQNINPSILANDIVTDFIDTASLSGQLAKITNFQSMFGRFDQIMVTGPASFNDISIVGQLSIGGNMIFADNSLNVLGADLELQSLKQGGISIAGKMIYIDANGNINSKGNATFAKEVNIGGTLSTNTISPNKDSDLVINLPEVSKTNQDFSKKGSNFIVNNASQSAVFALDQEGNMQASGSADFKNILANALKIVRNAQADTSFTETVATSSAGTATIITGETERTIITPYSTKDALIYLTSASDMDGLSPYVARQTIADESLGIKASFTIQISQRLNKDVKINWIIIN